MSVPWLTSRRARSAALLVGVVSAALAVATAPAPPATAQAPDASWAADLSVDADDTNVRRTPDGLRLDRTSGRSARPASTRARQPQGMLLIAPHDLAGPTDRVAIELLADVPTGSEVIVDVRGLRDDGTWTEWVPARPGAPALLEASVRTTQGRVTLRGGDGGASPLLRSLRFHPQLAAGVRIPLPLPRATYRAFATREGLVGGTTANGHVIRARDHFAALPSRRGLAPRGTGDYTVKVCADNGRCEWAPVWDVGPWNTTDDHWNPPELRQSWRDLAQGLPQAQAAFKDGYNGGRDEFGRQVTNPAGIDLADGMFWDGLRLRDNSWVTVTYLWTTPGRVAVVRAGLLHVRSGPGSSHPAVGLAAQHARLLVECAAFGQVVIGSQGISNLWPRIGPGQFVSAAHVTTPPGTPPCLGS